MAIVIDDTGKGSTIATSIAPSKFAKGGGALKVEVGPKPMSMTGHLSHGDAAATRGGEDPLTAVAGWQ